MHNPTFNAHARTRRRQFEGYHVTSQLLGIEFQVAQGVRSVDMVKAEHRQGRAVVGLDQKTKLFLPQGSGSVADGTAGVLSIK